MTEEHARTTDLTTMGATRLAELIRAGQVTATDVLDAHIARIEAVDGELNALPVRLFDEARTTAALADDAVRDGCPIGPLHGVPVSIKEQYRVSGTAVTLGLRSRAQAIDDAEGPLVTALRDAGAVVLGKTNVLQTLTGWESVNPLHGRTLNPHDHGRTPGGSSGGEAALIAAGGSPLGLGGDFGGSIRVPAHFTGIAGFKPTAGRLPGGDFPAGLFLDGQEIVAASPGPMAREVEDLETCMRVLVTAGPDTSGHPVPPVPWRERPDVAGMRIGVSSSNGLVEPSAAIRRAVEEAAQILFAQGAEIVPVTPPDPLEGLRIFLGAIGADGGSALRALLDGEAPVPQLAGILRGTGLPAPLRRVVAAGMDRGGRGDVARTIRFLAPRDAERYQQLTADRSAYRAEFEQRLRQAGVSALICPPAAVPAPPHDTTGDMVDAFTYSTVFNVLGAPAGVVPVTRVRDSETSRPPGTSPRDRALAMADRGSAGLPVGVQVAGPSWSDEVVLAVMGAIQAGAMPV